MVLLDKGGQKVIFKTFATGETMPTHRYAAGEVLVVVLASRLTIEQGELSMEAGAGDYVIFPADAPHSLTCLEAARILIHR